MINPNLPDWLGTVHHDGSEEFVSNPCPKLGDTVQIRLRMDINAPVNDVYLRTLPDGEQAFTQMAPDSRQGSSKWWAVNLDINEPMVHYRFIINANDGMWPYTAAGPFDRIPLDNTDFRLLSNQEYPEWLQTAVFYQIFPDRFADGEPDNNPKEDEFEYKGYGPKTFNWGTDPSPEYPFPLVFYGGDLQGITKNLDYLQHLGVNALYLNPIFSAHSNHKYDVTDYHHVDTHFGGNEALAKLRQALDSRQMRYILDIVPNHCGYWHPWFQKALVDKQADEAEFFTFNHHPDDYVSWLAVWTLPKLNYNSDELQRRIFKNHDSVFRYWLRPPYSADGWRVDVANMLGRQGETQVADRIISDIRQAVKTTKSDAYLVGESFFDATPQLQGNQWDAVMNYTGFTLPLWYWLDIYKEWAHSLGRHITAQKPLSTMAMINTWLSRMSAVPWSISLQQLNLVDSHDTPRIKSIVKGNNALHRLAVIIQFTFPGIPCVYYGDEIGMEDDPNLESRGCMIWDHNHWDLEMFDFYRTLISLRKNSTVLQSGGFQILAVETDTFVYQRSNLQGRIIVVAHRNKTPRAGLSLKVANGGFATGTRFTELNSGQEMEVVGGALSFPNHEQGATIWQEN